jgi:hypothetical protein
MKGSAPRVSEGHLVKGITFLLARINSSDHVRGINFLLQFHKTYAFRYNTHFKTQNPEDDN